MQTTSKPSHPGLDNMSVCILKTRWWGCRRNQWNLWQWNGSLFEDKIWITWLP